MSFQKSFFISYASHEEKPSKDPRGMSQTISGIRRKLALHERVTYYGTLCVCYLQEHNVIHEIFSARWEISISLFLAK